MTYTFRHIQTQNAMIFAQRDLKDHIMVVTHLPCVYCLRKALQHGIREFYYHSSDHCVRWSGEEKRAWKSLVTSFGSSDKSTSIEVIDSKVMFNSVFLNGESKK